MLAAQELTLQVDSDEAIEDGHVEGRNVRVDSVKGRVGRVAVKHVKAAERLNRSRDHACDTAFVRDVDLERHRRIEIAGNAFSLGPVQIGDDNECALACH